MSRFFSPWLYVFEALFSALPIIIFLEGERRFRCALCARPKYLGLSVAIFAGWELLELNYLRDSPVIFLAVIASLYYQLGLHALFNSPDCNNSPGGNHRPP